MERFMQKCSVKYIILLEIIMKKLRVKVFTIRVNFMSLTVLRETKRHWIVVYYTSIDIVITGEP